jgi:hypothetical protein
MKTAIDFRVVTWRLLFIIFISGNLLVLAFIPKYSVEVFIVFFVSLASMLPIKDFILDKVMILGKFNLAVEEVSLRLFFTFFSLLIVVLCSYQLTTYIA